MITEHQEGWPSINEFLLKIKTIVDQLALIGYVLTPKYHIDAIFEGFPFSYDTFVVSVESRLEDYIVAEIESLLLAQESRLDKHTRKLDHPSSSSVNLATQNT